jgi:hypothetical protein
MGELVGERLPRHRAAEKSGAALIKASRTWNTLSTLGCDAEPKPFKWTAKVGAILRKIVSAKRLRNGNQRYQIK